MAGKASGGQKLTPNPNVFAPAGVGGDTWGANGGDDTPIGGGATDQTGYSKPIAITPSDGETAANYIPNTTLGLARNNTMLGNLNNAQLSGSIRDIVIASGGNNAG